MSSALNVVNGTVIVPFGLTAAFRSDELDKLGYNAAITLAWPTVMGGFALMLSTRDWRRVSLDFDSQMLEMHWADVSIAHC